MGTRLTQLLHIQYPILQGGMAWVSDAKLAVAVSKAGGAGIIAAGGRTVDWVREQVREAKKETQNPFGVNIALMAPNKDELVDMICEEKVSFVTLGAGNPIPYFSKLASAGILKIPVVPSARLAQRVEANGADAIVIEGTEAGGHIGVLTTMTLMTQVIRLVRIPVVAAGGIGDGRGLAAALIMGASGVQMGSRFLVAEECSVHPNFKNKLIQADELDSVVTGQTIGHPVRGVRNSFTEKFLALERLNIAKSELERIATGTNHLAAVEGDVENGMVQAGQNLLILKQIEPVAVIIERIIAEAADALKKAPTLL